MKEEVSVWIPGFDVFTDPEACLCKAFPLLMIFSGLGTGASSGPSFFTLVWALFRATSFQWSHQIDGYNLNDVQALSIIKAGSMSSHKEAELQSLLPSNDANLLSLQETPLGCKSEMPGNLIFLESIFSIIGVGLDQDEYLNLLIVFSRQSNYIHAIQGLQGLFIRYICISNG